MDSLHGEEINGAVEGDLDAAILTRLIAYTGGTTGTIYGRHGKHYLLKKLAGYNVASRHGRWVVIVDLDDDFECAPMMRQTLLHAQEDNLCFRIAVREVEAWLIADRLNLAGFLGISPGNVPTQPDLEPKPKITIVNLARKSRFSGRRMDIVPRNESGRVVGPAYNSQMIEFVQRLWNPAEAAKKSDSLLRCINGLKALNTF